MPKTIKDYLKDVPQERVMGGSFTKAKSRALRGIDKEIKLTQPERKERKRNARIDQIKLDTFFNVFRNTLPMAKFSGVDHFMGSKEAVLVMNAIVDNMDNFQAAFNTVYRK